jgi:hypothetical protein
VPPVTSATLSLTENKLLTSVVAIMVVDRDPLLSENEIGVAAGKQKLPSLIISLVVTIVRIGKLARVRSVF